MPRTFLLLLPSAWWTIAVLNAGQDTLSGPVTGVVFDHSARALRWIVGVPGSAYLGPALADGIETGSVSPDGKLALAVKDGTLLLLKLQTEPGSQILANVSAPITHIAWTADSSSALIAGQNLTLWSRLPDSAERTQLANVDGAPWTALVAESGGRSAIGATPGGVYRLTADRAELLASIESPKALALSSCGAHLYIADGARKEVTRVDMLTGGTNRIASPSQGIDHPVALAVAPDRHSLLIANAGTPSNLLAVDPDTGDVTLRLDLPFLPTKVEPLPSGAFLLTGRERPVDSIQVLQLGSRSGVFFVPSAQ